MLGLKARPLSWKLITTVGSITAIALLGLSLPGFLNADSGKQLLITGEGVGKLETPMAVAADGKQIYIANSGQHQITVYDSRGNFASAIGHKGSGRGELDYPVDVALSASGDVYIADLNNQRIQVFNQKGDYQFEFPANHSIKPAALTVTAKGQVIVSDIANQTIKIFSENGELLKEFGGAGAEPGKLKFANGVTVNEQGGEIFVADSQNGRIQMFTMEGQFIKVVKDKGFGLAKGISYADGKLYVTDSLLHKIFILDKEGNVLDTYGQQAGTFRYPNDVFVDKSNVYVANRGSNQVTVNIK